MFKAGGKRFRPKLLLSVVGFYAPLLVKNAFFAAAGVEMLHTYSLIHDDLPSMDDSPLRRGVETLHVRYDEVTALLVGDALNTHAFYMLSIAPLSADVKVELIKSLSLNGGASGMVLGQAIDCYFEDTKISYEELKTLHINKTAKLIAASLQMGAIISNLSEKQKAFWYDFGLDLGVLFQVQDDIIDVTSDASKEGKPVNNDEHKNSFVNALGYEKTVVYKQELLDKLQKDLSQMPLPLQEEFGEILQKYFKEK